MMASSRVLDRVCRRGLVLVLVLGGGGLAGAQRPPEQKGAGEILHGLQELGVLGSVLYVAAHPDDENTRLLSWFANGEQVRTAYLSLTRGDGGQNLIGAELGDGLGILRTEELLEARRIDGAEQFFTRAVDFGYSKSAEETLEKWGRDEVLADVVRVVRTFRPDVIVTRFPADGGGGHGHHTASARLAHEAFEQAGDPRAFPEQIAEGLEPWQAGRLFTNASSWWTPDIAERAAADPARWIALDAGGFDPLLGASYTELAGRSRSQHKSQGFGAAETRGEWIEYLRLEKGPELEAPDSPDSFGGALEGPFEGLSGGPFEGIELGWARVEGGERVEALVGELVEGFDPRAPEASVPRLSALVRELDALATSEGPGSAWARHHGAAARELILQASGVVVGAAASSPAVARGDSIAVTLSVLQRRPTPAIEVVRFVAPDSAEIPVGEALVWHRPLEVEYTLAVNETQAIDEPYWLANPHETLHRPARGASGVEPTMPGSSVFRCVLLLAGGLEVAVDRPLMHTWVDRVDGERTRPVVVTPPASIEPVDSVVLVKGERAEVAVDVVALRDGLEGTLEASAPGGWTIEGGPRTVSLARRGERERVRLGVTRGAGAEGGALRLVFQGPGGQGGTSDRTQHEIDHAHVLPQVWYTPAEVRLVPLELAVSVATVGYIEGAGDEVPRALERLGVAVERIDPARAEAPDLARCDAIVTGVRAYNTVAGLARLQPLLLEWVERGGTLLVQYNTSGGLVIDAERLGPHPFALTRERVTLEDAPATALAPEHPLWNTPNRLEPEDFAGWVQERGLYFAGELDPAYTALVAWSDPGEEPERGALITCEHGKGRFTYTGISLFRQLPAGVPGAYRLLANLIARRTDAPPVPIGPTDGE